MGFDFDIEYKTGTTNTAVDSLSQRDTDSELVVIILPCWIDWDELRKEVAKDSDYAPIIQALSKGETVDRPFRLVHGVLYYKDRLAIPSKSPWVIRFLKAFYSTLMGGHAGALQTYRRIAANIYWPGMIRRVTNFVADCWYVKSIRQIREFLGVSYSLFRFRHKSGKISAWISYPGCPDHNDSTLY